MRHIKFCGALIVACCHAIREQYYRIAHDHAVDHGHPDAWLLCNRMLRSRAAVNDFLNRYTT